MNRRVFIQHIGVSVGLSCLGLRTVEAQSIDGETSARILNEKYAFATSQALRTKPIAEVMAVLGTSFIGTDYVAGILEQPGDESLVVCLDGLDCVTLCETVLALARCIKLGHESYDQYSRQLQRIRYRNGMINGYPSRLHYFSDWIYENDRSGIVRDITPSLGGKVLTKTIRFMSDHISSYAKLREFPEFFEQIREQEREISARKRFYLPKEDLKSKEKEIRDGDLLAFTSSKEGLDIAHTGIAIRAQGELKLLHAPQVGQQVQLTNESLYNYLARKQQMTGLVVARPLEPR